jgi:hypothetical protein
MAGTCLAYGEERKANILARNPEGNKLLGGPRRRLKDNIKIRSYESRV